MNLRFDKKLLSIRKWSRMVRLENVGVAAAGVFLGAFFSQATPQIETAIGALVFSLLVAAGNIHNDLIDLETDRINRPDRPLPSGAIAVKNAQIATIGMGLLALACSACVDLPRLLFAATIALLLFCYNTRFAGSPLLGNCTVAFLSATPFLWHGWPSPASGQWGAAAVAFLWTGVRELVKDFEDLPGDLQTGRQTLPIARGTRHAAQALGRRMAAAILLSVALPLLIGWSFIPSLRYETALLLLVVPPLISAIRNLRSALALPPSASLHFWRKGQQGIKQVMIGGMISLVIGLL